jgi:hypothetical protein
MQIPQLRYPPYGFFQILNFSVQGMERCKPGSGHFKNYPHTRQCIIADIVYLNNPVDHIAYRVNTGF